MAGRIAIRRLPNWLKGTGVSGAIEVLISWPGDKRIILGPD